MTASITLFAALTAATGAEMDVDLGIVSAQAPIPCTAAGANTITMTQIANLAYTVTAYQAGMQLSALAASSNSGATQARLGSLGLLNVYKDTGSGPIALVGGEIIANNAFTLFYDAALNTGAGGWHLFSSTGLSSTALNPSSLQLGTGAVMDRYLTTLASVTFTLSAANAAQQVIIPLAGAVLGDNVLIGPPAAHPTALALTGFVTASGSIALNAANVTAATVASIAAAYRVSVLH